MLGLNLMQIIYLHGFKSSPLSIKGQMLQRFCNEHSTLALHRPDLNMAPLDAMNLVSNMIESMQEVALIGSSLGGFYATYLAQKHDIPAVLINPALEPWRLFEQLFVVSALPYVVNEKWMIDIHHLKQLEQLAVNHLHLTAAEKILVLLQQGDETLDYLQAQRYYSQAQPSALILTDAYGNHAMDDFEEKIPLVIEFLSYAIKKGNRTT